MGKSIKLLAVLGAVYCLVYWAVSNPDSSASIVDKVDSAITSGVDFISEFLFDKKNEGV